MKLVYGIGVNDKKYPTNVCGKPTYEYDLWKGMLRRCMRNLWIKYPSYTGTTCSENFKSYTFFYEWCRGQIGFGNKDEKDKIFHLDKDILFKGNKHYSETNCVFVPQRINLLLNNRAAVRGELPIGVYFCKGSGRFKASCNSNNGIVRYLGSFNTPKEAFIAYKVFKEQRIKEVANEYRSYLDVRTYNALIEYTVKFED